MRSRLAWIARLAGLALAGSCADRAAPLTQWKVYLATDASVPALGQQVLVELIDDQGDLVSRDARRLIDGSRADLWPISFGVVPDGDAPMARLRVRFYRLDETGSDGLPSGSTMIDATALLPPLGAGVTETVLPLEMACFGVGADVPSHRTCDPMTGRLGTEPTLGAGVDPASLPAVGTWPPAAAVPCASTPPAGMACAPGGVFILGSTNFPQVVSGTVPEHLVQLAPFAIDVDEVTVGQIRPLVRAQKLPAPLTGDVDPAATPPECTYLGDSNPDHDAYPVNCVPWTAADLACSLLGKRLPTEAEWEYVAAGLGAKLPFPWGDDADVCNFAIVASGRSQLLGSPEPIECLTPGEAAGPHPHDGAERDVVDEIIPGVGGRVKNMGGNVSEWTADAYDAYTGPCWQTGSTLLVSPTCLLPGNAGPHTIRGGSWQDEAVTAQPYYRDFSTGDSPSVAAGFRCVKSM